MTFTVVYTDNVPDEFDVEREVLAGEDIELIAAEAAPQPIEDLLKSAEGVISSHTTFDRNLLARMTDCRVISRRGIGVDYVDLDAATDHGILVANVPDYCITEVSNHALALLLTLHRRIGSQDAAVREGRWRSDAEPIRRLGGQVLGLVAFGHIARSLAQRAGALDMDVVAYDPYVADEFIRNHGVSPTGFEELLECSDVVSIHTPLADETRGMIGKAEFRTMKDSAYLINTARGGVIDQEAAVRALESGEIRGAALDVLEEEPPSPTAPILDRDDVVLTPHMGHYSADSREELRRSVAENVLTVVDGGVPDTVVNETLLDG